MALAPCLVALLVWAIWEQPLRLTMLTLLVLAWMLEIEGDLFANNLVQTPLHTIGSLLFVKLNNTLPVPALECARFRGILNLTFRRPVTP